MTYGAAPSSPAANFTVVNDPDGNITVINNGDGTNYTYSPNVTIWGPIPNDTRRSLQPDIIACAVITWCIAVTFVALRLYTRTKVKNIVGPTDGCIILSVVCAVGVCASQIEQAVRGSGQHSWKLDYMQISPMTRASWYGILFYSLSLTLTKISILLLYRKIFNYGWIKQAIKIVLVAVLIIGGWLLASVSTACVPLKAFWDWSLAWKEPVYCQPMDMWWANQGLHLATDFVIVLLPMPVVGTLTLPKKQKFAVIGVFALGFFVCVVSVLRLVMLIQVETTPTADASYQSAILDFWTSVEVNTAISCACIMTLKPLVVKFFPRFLAPSSYIRTPTPPGVVRQVSRQGSRQSLARTTSHPDPISPASDRPRRTGLLPWMEETDDLVEEEVKTDGLDIEGQGGNIRTSEGTATESDCGEKADLKPLPMVYTRS